MELGLRIVLCLLTVWSSRVGSLLYSYMQIVFDFTYGGAQGRTRREVAAYGRLRAADRRGGLEGLPCLHHRQLCLVAAVHHPNSTAGHADRL